MAFWRLYFPEIVGLRFAQSNLRGLIPISWGTIIATTQRGSSRSNHLPLSTKTMQPLLELPDQTLPDEIDEEILDIFVEEVNEVLEEMTSNVTVWNTNPDNTEALKTLHRNFRTLKDSGCLVGAMVIGELGWKFENLLNQVIEGTIPTNEALLFLIDKVINLMPSMVEDRKSVV
jgi:hypothetical protein